MSWIGLTDHKKSLFNPAGLGRDAASTNAKAQAVEEMLTEGTLLIETRFNADEGQAQEVLSFSRFKDWQRALTITLTADGTMRLEQQQGSRTFKADIACPVPGRDSLIRLYYSWNGPERWAQLAVKLVENGQFYVATVNEPLPMPMLDALTIMRNGHSTSIHSDVAYVAISDVIEPVGLSAGVCAGTPVETPSGAVPIERLRLGDHVVTATHGAQPIRWITRRTVPAIGAFLPVRLRAPFFGLSEDLLVAPDHRIRVGGEEAEYMLGTDDVLLEAGRLVGSHAARAEGRLKTVTYYHILLDRHECLLHDTLWSESLYLGQLARQPERLRATSLRDLPVTAVPTHRDFARGRLTEVEARSLASVLHR